MIRPGVVIPAGDSPAGMTENRDTGQRSWRLSPRLSLYEEAEIWP
jgi:hypothetical protein